MKKVLLVVFVGLVLTMNLYGCVNSLIMRDFHHSDEVTTSVYME